MLRFPQPLLHHQRKMSRSRIAGNCMFATRAVAGLIGGEGLRAEHASPGLPVLTERGIGWLGGAGFQPTRFQVKATCRVSDEDVQ